MNAFISPVEHFTSVSSALLAQPPPEGIVTTAGSSDGVIAAENRHPLFALLIAVLIEFIKSFALSIIVLDP
jgi:hypothetical protein